MIEAQVMTPTQLFDNADAYVLGLLEDTERDAFEAGLVAASPAVRAQIREILEPHLPTAAVLGYNEVVQGVEVESMGLVTLPEEATQQAQPAA